MNAQATLHRAHRAWLLPIEHKRGARACVECGEDANHVMFFSLGGENICRECVEDRTYSFDVYPEMEEENRRCSSCGCRCEDCVTVIGRKNYCADCVTDSVEDD